MPTVQVEAQLSFEDLLKAVEQLSSPELEQFVHQVISLQAHRKAPGLPKDEAELLLKINQGLPFDLQDRYNELIAKRQAELLTSDEHTELLHLTEEVERQEAQPVRDLAELAHLRQLSLTQLLEELGLQPPEYA
jgi:hypothetical protein